MNTSKRASFLTKHSTPGLTFSRSVRNIIVVLLISLTFPSMALPLEEEPAKNGVHWAKINYCKPLPGTMEPDPQAAGDIHVSEPAHRVQQGGPPLMFDVR